MQINLTESTTSATHSFASVGGKIILIASGKGGVGKTCCSTTLAHILSLSGKRVLLFDGDLGLANVDIQLGISPQYDLGGVFLGNCTFSQAIFKYTSNFHILSGRSGSGALASLSQDRLNLLKRAIVSIAKNYDYVLVDLGAGVGGMVKSLSDLSHDCILVLTPDPTAITDAYAFMKVMLQRHSFMNLSLLVNQVDSVREGEQTYQLLKKSSERFLNFTPELLGIVRRDLAMRSAVRLQKLLLEKNKDSYVAQDMIRIAKNLLLNLNNNSMTSISLSKAV